MAVCSKNPLIQQGQVIGFGARVIGKGEPKYLNSPETALFQKGNELYGLFEANGGKMVLSKGLGSHTIPIRIGNRPEVTLVELLSKKT